MASKATQRKTTRVTRQAVTPAETAGGDGATFGALDQSLAQLEAKLSALQSRIPDPALATDAPPSRRRAASEPVAEPEPEEMFEPEETFESDAMFDSGRPAPAKDPFARLARSLPLADAFAPAPAAAAEPVAEEGRFTGAVAREIGRMRAEMGGDMHRRFEELGREISALRTSVASDTTGAKLEAEFDRVYDGLEAVAAALDKRGDEATRKELEVLRREVSKLAAEDTLHAVGRGQDELARRLAQHQASVDPEIATIRGQLDELALKIDSGDTGGLKALERRIASIAQAVEAVRAQTGEGPDLTAVEARLDDIARAVIAASQTAPEIDTAPFERIEARIANQQRRMDERDKRRDADYADAIGGIAKRLEFVGEAQEKTVELTNRLASDLTDRFAAMTADGALTRDALAEDLSPRFAQIAAHVQGVNGRVDDWGKRLDGWGQRLTDEARRPREAEINMFKALAGRLDTVSDRLAELPDAATDDQNWAALEARMSAVMQKLDRVPTDTLDAGALDELRAQLASIAWKLEQPQTAEVHDEVTGRLDALAERMDAAPTDLTEAAIERISRTVTGELEERISDRFDGQLSARLGDLTSALHQSTAPLAELGPRMDALEEAMGDAQVTLVDTARTAAEDVVKAMLEQGQQMAPDEVDAVNALDEDVKKLEELTRSSDERNTKTFDAVHGTLLKIVERLDTLDGMVAKATQAPDPAVIAATHAALMEQSPQAGGSLMDRLRGRAAQGETAQQEAAPQIVAAPSADAAGAGETAFAEPTVTPAFDGSGTDSDAFITRDYGGLDPDTPLEPDTGEPRFEDAPGGDFDPAAIAGDVIAGEGQNDPAADFLAVARRKAQAVADENAFTGDESSKKGKAKPAKGRKAKTAKGAKAPKPANDEGGGSALKRYRRPMLLAAAVAIAAVLALPHVASTVTGVMGGGSAPVVVAEAEPETFGEVAPIMGEMDDEVMAKAVDVPVREAAATTPGTATDAPADEAGFQMAAVDGAEGEETTTFTVPVEVPGTDSVTTRSIDPVTEIEEPVSLTPVTGPVTDITFTEADGPADLVEAARGGDPRALHEIAGRTEDTARALALYKAAAERGLAPSQYRLGQAYEKGRGTEVDYTAAKQWYARAAEAGNTSAMHNLAVLYAMGAEGEADPVLAGRWFVEAGNHGVKDSQYNLGILYAQGTGVDEDLTESYKWFDAAAKSGDPEAGGKRDEVAGALAPGELETARTKAGAFRAIAADVAANRVSVPDSWRVAPALDPAEMKKAVRNVQAILNKNGFDAGVADGVMGKKTRTAILQFQEATGLPKTGQIDDALVKALLERNA